MKEFLLPFAINIVSGVILMWLSPYITVEVKFSYINILLLLSYSVVVAAIIYVFLKLYRFYRYGICGILTSMTKGKGSTKAILNEVRDDFRFMGIAAGKWIKNKDLLEEKITVVATRKNTVKFLLLDPGSDEAKKMSLAATNNPVTIPNKIQESIRYLKGLKDDKDLNIRVKVYNFLPIFRIAITNQDKAYVGFYRTKTEGVKSPQLVVKRKNKISYFQPYNEFFDEVWSSINEEAF